MELTGKKATIVGLARSGVGAARLLDLMGAAVTVTDIRDEKALADSVKLLPSSVRLCLGSHPDEIFNDADLIVVSPGVPLAIRPLADARARGKRVIGELELAFQIIETRLAELRTIPFFAITGSNGKSTTTTLLNHMMTKAGIRTLFGGNIGNALTEEIYKTATGSADMPDAVVAEISSFQLEAIESFQPHVAAILNITPDHLDRYSSMKEYAEAKAGIFMNQQPADILVLNADDEGTMRLYDERLRSSEKAPYVCFFSRKKKVEGVYLEGGSVFANLRHLDSGDLNAEIIRADEIRINGVHNLENAMAASAMALLANCPLDAVKGSLREFAGLEHRLELVREINGVRYINDSKGTNVGAVLKSIESFDSPIILIAGGRDKAGDFSALRKLVSEKVKMAVLIGEAADKIEKAIAGAARTEKASDLKDAVEIACRNAVSGDVVLLSPACASFDMFADFEDRGRQFREIALRLEACVA